MRTNPYKSPRGCVKTLMLLCLTGAPMLAGAAFTNWVAYNDHASGTGTAPNVTTYSSTTTDPNTVGGPLKDFSSGSQVTAGVSITAKGQTLNGATGSAVQPDAGTPAALEFNGKVDFTSSAFYFCASPYTATHTITFTNLDPTKRYIFKGVPQRGVATYTTRWGTYWIEGAASFMPAHEQGPGSPGIVTNGWSPYGDLCAPNTQVAIDCGANLCGDLIVWTDIQPINGSFSIVASNWLAATPGGAANSTYTYAINAFSLYELESTITPIVIVRQPVGTNLPTFRPFSLSVQATGTRPRYQWYHNSAPIQDATNATYSVASAQTTDSGSYHVAVANDANSLNSTIVQVTVIDDNIAPTIVSTVGSADFQTITVAFSENMNTNYFFEVFDFALAPDLGGFTAYRWLGQRVLILTTFNQAAPATTYTLTLPTTMTDLAGNPVPEPRTAQFRSWVTNYLGGVVFQVYTNLSTSDNNITNVLTNANFPDNAALTFIIPGMNTRSAYPDDTHEGYGGLLRTLFIPPYTGQWRFFIYSDDLSLLYLNPIGTDPAGKVKVAESASACCISWSEPPNERTSAAIDLVGGRGYYIEAVYKEGTGGDYCYVAARGEIDPTPASALTNIMTSAAAAPFLPENLVGILSIVQQPANVTVEQPGKASFTVRGQTTLGSPIGYQWQRSDDGGATYTDIPNAGGATFTVPSTLNSADNGDKYRAIVRCPAGELVSQAATLTVAPDSTSPHVLSASRAANGTTILVTFSEPVAGSEAWNYAVCNAYDATSCLAVNSVLLTNNNTQVYLETEVPNLAVTYRVTVSAEVVDPWGNPVANPNNAIIGVTATYQQGDANGYTGTVDTYVSQANPTTSYGTATTVLADNLSPLAHGLIRFDNIFGTGAGQIPPDVTISSATLSLYTANWGNDIRVNRMLVPWSGSSTWNDVGSANDGVSLTAGDAVSTPELTFATVAVGSTVTIDVTASLRFWATNGGPNYGWVFIDSSDDGYQCDSSEGTTVSQRPLLQVSYAAAAQTNAIAFTTQPAATNTVNERQGVTLSVAVTGTTPTYQWFKNDAAILGATTLSYAIASALPADAGKYYCRVSNLVSWAQSSNSWLIVVPDTTAPTVLSAQGGLASSTNILVTFSEGVNQAQAEALANYTLQGPGGITIQSAAIAGNVVTLSLSGARTPGQNYSLVVKDIHDLAVTPNMLAPNPTTLPVSTLVEAVAINTHTWKYLQQTTWGAPQPCLDGTLWATAGYDDTAWQTGSGVFYGERANSQPGTLDGSTILTYLNVFTNGANALQETNFYFRTTFNLPAGSTNGVRLLIHSMIDDGAVFYLNGQRADTVRFTANPAYCTNFASSGGGQTWAPALTNAGQAIGLAGLVPGQNTLAVEVHQNNGTSSDITFGLLLETEVPTLGAAAPTLTHAYNEVAKTLTLSWAATGYNLEESTSVSGPWTVVSATSPQTVSTATGTKFYRLRQM
jgi:hypothetical protein